MDRKLLSAVIVTAVITSLSSVVLARVLEASPATAATPHAQTAAAATGHSIAVLKRIMVNDNLKLNDIQAKIDGIMFRRLKAIDDRTKADTIVLSDTARMLGTYAVDSTYRLVVKTEDCVINHHCNYPSP